MEILAAFALGLVVYFIVLALYFGIVGCPRELPNV